MYVYIVIITSECFFVAWKIGKARGNRLRTAHNQFMPGFMHFPGNNDESSPPALADKTSQRDKTMANFSNDNVGRLCILVVADAFFFVFV